MVTMTNISNEKSPNKGFSFYSRAKQLLLWNKLIRRSGLIMNEFVDGFKMDLEELINKWYEDLELLVDGAMFNMSFVEDDPDGNYLKLQEVMIKVLKERFSGVLNDEES